MLYPNFPHWVTEPTARECLLLPDLYSLPEQVEVSMLFTTVDTTIQRQIISGGAGSYPVEIIRDA